MRAMISSKDLELIDPSLEIRSQFWSTPICRLVNTTSQIQRTEKRGLRAELTSLGAYMPGQLKYSSSHHVDSFSQAYI